MSTSTLILIILAILIIGIANIKRSLAKASKAIVGTVDNGAEVLFTASTVGRVKGQAYLLDGIDADLNKVGKLKDKYPDFFIS